MYCQKCGTRNEDNAYKCVSCGTVLKHGEGQPQQYQAPSAIPNYLPQAILVTLFCCLPFGIPAIVCASQVNGKAAAGDIQGAINASKSAKSWCWISFGLAFAVVLLYILAAIVESR